LPVLDWMEPADTPKEYEAELQFDRVASALLSDEDLDALAMAAGFLFIASPVTPVPSPDPRRDEPCNRHRKDEAGDDDNWDKEFALLLQRRNRQDGDGADAEQDRVDHTVDKDRDAKMGRQVSTPDGAGRA
jgi:hypothetical protein